MLIGNKIDIKIVKKEAKVKSSECCDAPIWISIETTICGECNEHCDTYETEIGKSS